jgi:DNA-binding MarR family transcriptional regulator
MTAANSGDGRVTRGQTDQAGQTGTSRTSNRGTYDHLRLEETVGFLLSDATRTMVRVFTRKIAVHGIGMGIFQFLRILWEEDGLTQSELSARARMKGPSAVAAIKELEWRGFVRRVDDRHDRRKVRLFLTAEGRKLYDIVMPDIESVRQLMLAGFGADEQAELQEMLQRIRRNLSPEPVRTFARRNGAPADQPATTARQPARRARSR